MTPESLFDWASRVVLPGWLLLVFLPRWKWTHRVVGVLIPVLLGGLYAVLFARFSGTGEGGFDSLAGIRSLFESPWLLLAGWVHYLVFDLFVGAWEVRDSQRVGIHHLLVIPCMALTLMLGPVGLLLYLVLRAVIKRKIWHAEEEGDPA